MYHAIVAEVSSLEILYTTAKGVWFKTDSPGPLDPVVMFLTWSQLEQLAAAKSRERN
jgi:hypothetical protein